MKNFTLKKSIFRKGFIFCLCMMFVLACSSLFVYAQNNKSNSVYATNSPSEYDLSFSVQNDEPSGYVSASNVEAQVDTNAYYWTHSWGSTPSFTGGTKVTIEENGAKLTFKDSSNAIIGTSTLTIYVPQAYTLNGVDIKIGNSTAITYTSGNYTFEELDSNYSGNINFTPNLTLNDFEINLYYENSTGTYSSTIAESYNIENEMEIDLGNKNFNFSVQDENDKPQNKEHTGWLFNTNAFEGFIKDEEGECTYNGKSLNYYYMSMSSCLTLTGADPEFGLDFIFGEEVKPGYYRVDSVKGYGEIDQDESNPLIIAEWENTYTITLDNYSNCDNVVYWDQFESTKDNTDLYGVRTSDSAEGLSQNLVISESTTYPFMDSVGGEGGLAFKKSSDIGSSDWAEYDSNYYYVYNYGHYITDWIIKAEVDGKTLYASISEDGDELVWTETDEPINIDSLRSFDLAKMSASLDDQMAGVFGFPDEVTLTPVWAAAKINTTFGSDITFGEDYSLTGGEVDPGKTLFAYYYGDSEDNLISETGVWNYQNIPHNNFTGTSASEYDIELTAYGLDNVYKIQLDNIKTNEKVYGETGDYELESDNYKYQLNDDSTHLNELTYNWFEELVVYWSNETEKEYSDNSYALVDKYIEYLSGYKQYYVDQIAGANEIFSKVFYSSGILEDENVLSATQPTLYIYLANNQSYSNLPKFKTKYYTTILWKFNDFELQTTEYQGGGDGEQDYSNELEKSLALTYTYSVNNTNTTATAKYVNKLNLYYIEDNASSYSYISAKHFSNKISTLDFSQIGLDIEFENHTGAGWVFDYNVALSDTYSIDNGSTKLPYYTFKQGGVMVDNFADVKPGFINVINQRDDLTTKLYISEINKHDKALWYVTTVSGDPLIQEDDNPILTMKKSYKYHVTIDNSSDSADIYWAQFDSTKNNSDLYGANSHEAGNGFTTTTITVADHANYAYPIMTSEATKDGIAGLSFYKNDDFEDSKETYAAYLNEEKWYYVYNYGHYISGYQISFDFNGQTGWILYGDGLMAHVGTLATGVDPTIGIDILVNGRTLRDIVKIVDDYVLAENIEVTEIKIVPVWSATTIDVYVNNTNVALATKITFGDEYTLANGAVSPQDGQSLFAYTYDTSSSDDCLIATNDVADVEDGIWNYQNISKDYLGYNSDDNSDGNNTYNIGVGTYGINVAPVYVDNIYKIKLENTTANENGVYELQTNSFVQDKTLYSNMVNFDDVAAINCGESGYNFVYYNEAGQELIDDYVLDFKGYKNAYIGNLAGGFNIFNKVYTTAGTIQDSNNKILDATNPTFYIYLSNNQPIQENQLPKFQHDLSMLIHWENVSTTGNTNTYLTSNYNKEGDYSKELISEDNSITYVPATENVWSYNDGGSEGNFELKARYVYSVRLYSFNTDDLKYNSDNTGDYEKGTGYFGRYTEYKLKDEYDFINKPSTIPQDKNFECWMFDVVRAKKYEYNVEVTATTLIVTKDSNKWVFTYDATNKYNNNVDTKLYYITGITSGYTRFIQNENEPIIYSKWANIFDLTINNSRTHWYNNDLKNVEEDNDLYGAYSEVSTKANVEHDEFYKTSFKIANQDQFKYTFMASEKVLDGETKGTAFFHNVDFNDNYYISSTDGYYYVFNYGHYITHWVIKLTVENKDYYFTMRDGWIEASEQKIDVDDLQGAEINFKWLAENADEFAAKFEPTATLELIPVWAGANFTVLTDDPRSGDDILAEDISFADINGYNLATSKTKVDQAKSIMHYYWGENDTNMIASIVNNNGIAGIWNYQDISASEYKGYNSVPDNRGSGVYKITIKPFYVDNIYRVTLNNADNDYSDLAPNQQEQQADNSIKSTYKLDNCEFSFNLENNQYRLLSDDIKTITFKESFNDYTFKSFAGENLIDNYISTLQALRQTYLDGINTKEDNCFDIFKKVYHTNGDVSSSDVENDTLTVFSEPEFFIYLANNRETGALPVFKRDYFALIFWENVVHDDRSECQPTIDTDRKKHYIYPTNELNLEVHKEEIHNYQAHGKEDKITINKNTIAEEDFSKIWKLSDGVDGETVTFKAHYFRKNYTLEIETINKENRKLERRGYVILDVFDTVYEAGTLSVENTGGRYVIVYDSNKSSMIVYKYTGDQNVTDYLDNQSVRSEYLVDSINNNSNFILQDSHIIRVYEGCSLTMYVCDQGQAPTAMATEDFDDMIGYKFTGEVTQKLNNEDMDSELFDIDDNNSYLYFIDEAAIKEKDFANRDVFKIEVYFTRIIYNLTFEIDNVIAGEFSVLSNGRSSGYKTNLTLENISVQNVYKMDYLAYAGFKLKDNAFDFHNGIHVHNLQKYNEEEGSEFYNINQEYLLTLNDYQDGSLNGTWLREYFYIDHTEYDVENTALGTLTINTRPIEFIFGLKVYDPTYSGEDNNVVNNGYIIETLTSDDYAFSLDKDTGYGYAEAVGKYLKDDLDFFYYMATDGITKYAVLNSRLFFPKNFTTTDKNFYTPYPFLLKEMPTNKATIISNILSNMVNNFEEGKIISVNDRNIYLMLEVRKLLTVEMQVQQLENDTNSTIRTTALKNAENNFVSITIEREAEVVESSVANGARVTSKFFKTSNKTISVYAYTYLGLENILSSQYDAARYDGVIYNLDGYDLEDNKFEITNNGKLIISYIPNSMTVDIIYTLDGEPLQGNDIQTYLIDSKPTGIYHIGTPLTYSVECIAPEYDLSVTINGTYIASTDMYNRSVRLIKDKSSDNRYFVSDKDFQKGIIEIVVDVKLRASGNIEIKYQLANSSTETEFDDYGTFTVIEGDLSTDTMVNKAENVTTAKVSIIEGRDVYLSIDLPYGYNFIGIKKGNDKVDKNIKPDGNGLIKIVGDFNKETHSGNYFIVIDKLNFEAVLTGEVNPNSIYSMMDYTKGSDWSNRLTGLYVGGTIALKTEFVSERESFKNFYYFDRTDKKIKIQKEENSEYALVVLTSELLEAVDSSIIEFGVEVVERFLLDVVITGEEYIAEDGFKLENLTTGEEYAPRTYVDKGTIISLVLQTQKEGKYDIKLVDLPNKIDQQDFESIKKEDNVEFELDENCVCEITITPKLFKVNVEENLYNDLKAVVNNTPIPVGIENYANNIQSSGQRYNDEATIKFVRRTENVELANVFVSYYDNQDNKIDLMIVFNDKNNLYVVYKLVAAGENEVVNLKEYGFTIIVNETNVTLTYVTYNNVDIRFDYKEYKIIQA